MKNQNQTGLKNFKPKISLNHNIFAILFGTKFHTGTSPVRDYI